MSGAQHLIIAPIVLPLLVGALMLLVDARSRATVIALNIVSTFALLAIAIRLLLMTHGAEGDQQSISVYLLGDWPAQFGIVLVADRLSALMLVLTAIVGCAALCFALARWHRAGAYFHPLFQFQLMGLNGAFLTGDLFNLFVFFEVLLAASYGLALHGSGLARVKAGLHYITINLVASLAFLIGASLIYGAAGTLNMADLASRLPQLADTERVLFEIGASILAIAFLVKAAMWPLGFWLPTTYTAASAPVAALFSVMTKVGIYVVLRVGSLLSDADTGVSALLGNEWLFVGGTMTVLFGIIGMLASQDMMRLTGFAVLVSSGSLLAAISLGAVGSTGGALLYMVSSTLAIGGFFLLIELVERGRAPEDDILAVTLEAYGDEIVAEEEGEGDVGIAVPGIMAILGIGFIAFGLLLSGLPPLSGFIAKFAILQPLFNPPDATAQTPVAVQTWVLTAILMLSGLATLIAMTRAGIRSFWASIERELPHIHMVEIVPVGILLVLCVVLTVQAGPAMGYMRATAEDLLAPGAYVKAVLSAQTQAAQQREKDRP